MFSNCVAGENLLFDRPLVTGTLDEHHTKIVHVSGQGVHELVVRCGRRLARVHHVGIGEVHGQRRRQVMVAVNNPTLQRKRAEIICQNIAKVRPNCSFCLKHTYGGMLVYSHLASMVRPNKCCIVIFAQVRGDRNNDVPVYAYLETFLSPGPVMYLN